MPVEAQRFSFTEIDKSLGAASSLPYLPFTLSYQDTSLSVSGLLDTGATVNVLPYDTGRQLGAVWDQQTTPVHLTGNLARFEARVLIVSATVGEFAPVRLAFAWTRANNVPLILGQVNFFGSSTCVSSGLKRYLRSSPKSHKHLALAARSNQRICDPFARNRAPRLVRPKHGG